MTELPATRPACSAATFVARPGEQAVIARSASSQYAVLTAEWRNLWRAHPDEDSGSLVARVASLERLQTSADSLADQCGFQSQRLNEEVTADAYEVVAQEFST